MCVPDPAERVHALAVPADHGDGSRTRRRGPAGVRPARGRDTAT
ncbi:hypothetical protein [Streptomyces sp. GC420]